MPFLSGQPPPKKNPGSLALRDDSKQQLQSRIGTASICVKIYL